MNARTLPHFIPGLSHVAKNLGVTADEKRMVCDIVRISPTKAALLRADTATDVSAVLAAAMRTQMAAGMRGKLPGCERSAYGTPLLTEQPAYIEVMEALQQSACFEALAKVLQDSPCALVAHWRKAMVDAYVQNNLAQACDALQVLS